MCERKILRMRLSAHERLSNAGTKQMLQNEALKCSILGGLTLPLEIALCLFAHLPLKLLVVARQPFLQFADLLH